MACVAEEVVAVGGTWLIGLDDRVVGESVAEIAPDGEARAGLAVCSGRSGRRCEGSQEGNCACHKHRYSNRSG